MFSPSLFTTTTMESTMPDTGRERSRNYDSSHARDYHSSNDVKGSRNGRLDDYNERGRNPGYDSKDRRSPVAHHRDRDERSRDYDSSKSYKGERTGHDADTFAIQSESRRMDYPGAAESERPSDHIRVRGRGHHHYGSHRDSAWHEAGQDGHHNSSHSSVRYSTSSEKHGHRRHSRDESSSYRDKYERSRDISERREISTTRDFVPFERYDSLNSVTQSNASGYASHSRGGLESRDSLQERDESRHRHRSRTEDREHKHRGRSSSRSSSSGHSGSARDRSRSRHHSRRSRSTRRTRDHSRRRSTSRSPSRSRTRSRSKERGDDDGKKRKRRHRSESRERRKRKRKDREREKEKDKRRKKEKDEEERRSVLTGKKIKLRVKQDKDDIEREKNRKDLLSFLNSTLG